MRVTFLLMLAAALPAEYLKPPKPVLDILNAPKTPALSLSPARTHILLVDRVLNPSIEDLSRPMLRLAGLRIDPATNGPHLTSYITSVTIKNLTTLAEKKVALPAGVRIFDLEWSNDGRWVAIANAAAASVELWILDVEKGTARKLPGVAINAVLDPFKWLPDNKTLLAATIPAGRPAAPKAPVTPPGPRIQESDGKAGPTRTYQDMLTSEYDESLFEYHATSQLALIDTAAGKVSPVGKPGIHGSLAPAPSGKNFLVTTYHRPFSYLLPVTLFAREVEVWSPEGAVVYKVASLPVSERIPILGVPTGPRSVQWMPTEPQTLVWVEALDGGNPKEKVPHRDKVMAQRVPTRMAPMELTKTEHRAQGTGFGSPAIQWLEDGRMLVSEYEPNQRLTRSSLINPKTRAVEVIVSRNAQDRYRDPGTPVTKQLPTGGRVIAVENNTVLLRGDGASSKGDFPFLDRLPLGEMKPQRLFQSDPEKFQEVVGVLSPDGSRLLIRSESPTEPPNYFIRDAAGKMTAITNFPDPAPVLRQVKKQLVTYKREDGVPLSFTLYLPPGYKEGDRLPTVVWAYPLEYNDADTAGQIRGSLKRFNTITGYSHLFFLMEGYAILDNAAMPVVGDPETVNNTYIEQVVASAKAAIDKAVEMGVTDRNRVGVGGHSYGAFMTANLLAHSDLFRAGIARSGAYNRTLTPFGFQSERRTIWEAPETYLKMSPFLSANKIKEPILLIHGEADNNQGTFPIQSDRMYQAIRGNGGTVRLVFLPFESHGYAAQETIEHVLAEQINWFNRFVKNAGELTTSR
jgi:dipeptidyl aminopeptidase/acylaminoacyl peptidase